MIDRIAKRIIAGSTISIRNLLKMNINLQIVSLQDDSFVSYFSGPVNLTMDGIIKWTSNGTFDIKLFIQDGKASIIDTLSDNQLKNLCALFNTINGNVNQDTYKKYIK